ncbi:MAG: nicotinamide-nucleotide amidohydrolase family protein, partial [Clostridia bacterium]|nr:nicotinamide-nucleotide amidohydrolase family protein [Clostridia bacterium]
MKSVFITNSLISNSNTEILSLLLNSLSGDLTVRSVLPEELPKVIRRELWKFDYVIISGEFSNSDEFTDVCDKYFPDEQLFSQEGEFMGFIARPKSATLAVLPKSTNGARIFIAQNLSPVNLNYGFEHFINKTVYVASTDEQNIKQTISEFENTENPTVTVKRHSLYTEISITAFGNTEEMADGIMKNATEKISLLLGDDVFSAETPFIEQATIDLLIAKGLKIATAESCTGGQISKMITAVPNSSSIFEIGIASYSNRIKQHALSVPKEILQNYGAISKQT